eukprot:6187603-Pyramimonas_sp.AAC.1
MGLEAGEVQKVRGAAARALGDVGLMTHELTESTDVDDALGAVIDEAGGVMRVSERRCSRLRGALQSALCREIDWCAVGQTRGTHPLRLPDASSVVVGL